jgi:hypothetical protein
MFGEGRTIGDTVIGLPEKGFYFAGNSIFCNGKIIPDKGIGVILVAPCYKAVGAGKIDAEFILIVFGVLCYCRYAVDIIIGVKLKKAALQDITLFPAVTAVNADTYGGIVKAENLTLKRTPEELGDLYDLFFLGGGYFTVRTGKKDGKINKKGNQKTNRGG